MKHEPAMRSVRLLKVVAGICIALCLGQRSPGASPVGDVVGKVSVGYQGWFACAGDGSPNNNWTHWSENWSQPPSPANMHVKTFPDMREYAKVYQPDYANFGNGQPASLFSSYDQQTVSTHFRWMAENGIDTAALQRFGGGNTDAVAPKVRAAAETYGRKFYLMYDFNGFSTPAAVQADWLNKGAAFTSSPAYARQNGKPVVCMWGIGMSYMSTAQNLEIIDWFKNTQGCYVIGGVQREWRADTANASVYRALNMISPWMIGFIGNVPGADNAYTGLWVPDQTYCNANGIDYQPCVLPGDVSVPGQRSDGNLLWRMFYNAKRLRCQGIYVSMFDEFDEGNQIAKTAANSSMVPVGSGLPTLDQDGTNCSSDYYLRLTGDGGRMFRGAMALTPLRPTPPALPIVFPPAPSNLIARGGTSQVALSWQAVSGPAEISGYTVKRATVSGGPYSTIATNLGHVSYTDSGLANGTTYYYVVSAVNSLGESADSSAAQATPEVTYAVNSGGGAAGSFTADANYSGGNTASTGAAIDTSAVVNPAPQEVYKSERWGANTYTFSDLVVGANYKVRLHFAETFYASVGIRAFNVSINGTQVLANFDVFAEAGAKNKATIREFTATANPSGKIVIQYSNIPGKDNAKSSGIEILSANVVPLLAPPGLTASAVSSSEVSLSWTVAAAATSYNIKRATTSGGPYTNIATGITEAAYWDSSLNPGTTYYYVVTAVNAGGESTNSPQASATTQVLPAPSAPDGLNTTSGNAQVILNWNGSAWASGYKVKRSTNSGGGYTVIATNVTGVSYTDTGLANGTTYYYVVSANNASGESANSAEASVTPGLLSRAGWVASASPSDANAPTPRAFDGDIGTRWATGTPQVNGQWFQVDMGSTNTVSGLVLDASGSPGDYPRGYQVTLSNDGITWSSPVASGAGSLVTNVTFTPHPARYIRITQTGSAPGLWWSIHEFNAFGIAGVLPSTPAGLSAVAADGVVALNWNAASGASTYNVKRASTSGGPYMTVATNLGAPAYTDAGLSNGTSYYFAVSATNAAGESADSAEVTATPSVFNGWLASHFTTIQRLDPLISGLTADPDNDGEPNLMEFATAQNPLASNILPPDLVKNGTTIEFTYTRSVAAMSDGVTFTVEWSDSLASGAWSSAGVIEQIISDNGTVQSIRATFPAGETSRFARLRVEK